MHLNQFIHHLITIGKRTDLEELKCSANFEALLPFAKFMLATWDDGYSICSQLSVEDHIALLKAMVLAEKYFSIGNNSASSAIRVSCELEERVPYETYLNIAKWIVRLSNNNCLPFGSASDYNLFIKYMDRFQDNFTGTLRQRIALERCIVNSGNMKVTAKIKEERLKAKKQKAEDHLSRKKLRDIEHARIAEHNDNVDT
jgi:hypothetical protein